MPEPITTATILWGLGGVVVSGIIGNRADEFAVSNWRKFLENTRQYRPGENHELQRALYRAYLQATLQICAQRGEKLGMPVSKWLLGGIPKLFQEGAPFGGYKEKDEQQWIDRAKDGIYDRLKNLEVPSDYENKELDDLQKEVELLMQVKETTQREAQLRQPLIEREMKDLEAKYGPVPDDFKRLFEKCWFNYICACFQYQLAANSHIADKFQNRLMAKITARKASGEVSEITVAEIQIQLQHLGGEMSQQLHEVKSLLGKQQRKLDEVERDIWLPILALEQDTNARVRRVKEVLDPISVATQRIDETTQRIEDNLTPKIDTIDAGVKELLGKKTETESQTNSQTDSSGIEQRYRELALPSCDIIDLAKLPGANIYPDLPKLRHLYVPLRVKISGSHDSIFRPATVEERKRDQDSKEQDRIASSMIEIDKPIENPKETPIGQLLTKARHIVVLGEAGAGKTTLIRWIATAYLLRLKNGPDRNTLPDSTTLPNEDWLPIILRCRDFDHSYFKGPLDDMMLFALRNILIKKKDAQVLLSVLRERLKTGSAILLIDGLDEIPNPRLCEHFCERLKRIHTAYPNAPIIVTSRQADYRDMESGIREFEHVEIADLSNEDQEAFARRWYSLNNQPAQVEKLVKEFMSEMHSSERIGELAANPFFLTALARLKQLLERLPTRRSSIYRELIYLLFRSRINMPDFVDPEEALPQLQYLAYEMCDRGVAQLRQDEIIDLLQRVCTEYPSNYKIYDPQRKKPPDKFLRRLEHRTNIIKEINKINYNGQSYPIFEFGHKTFQEYLAALAIRNGYYPGGDGSMPLTEKISLLAGRLSEEKLGNLDESEMTVPEKWREVIRLCVSCNETSKADDLIMAIVKPRQDENVKVTARPRSVLATLCLADEPYVSDETARYVLREFVSHINSEDGKRKTISTSSDNATIHSRRFNTSFDDAAIEVARSRWFKILTSILIEAFGTQDSNTRIECGGVCGIVVLSVAPRDEPERREWFISKLDSNEETSMIEAALGILQFAFESAFEPGSFNPAYAEQEIIEKLLSMLSGSAPSSLASAWAMRWLNDSNHGLRAWRPSTTELKQLVSVANDLSTDADARDYLCFILGKRGKRSKVKQAVERLIMRLHEKDSKIRQRAARGLGEIENKQSVEALLATLGDNERFVRRDTAWALGKIKDKRAVEALITALGDSAKEVRSNAAWALGEIKNKQSVEALLATLGDSEHLVRSDTAWALGKIKSARAVKVLMARLEDIVGDVRQAAAWALGEIKDKRAVHPLISKLKSDVVTVRASVAAALGKIKDQQAVAALIMTLEDTSSTVRKDVAWALGEIKDRQAVEALMARLDDDNDEVWKYAAAALRKINDITIVETLIVLLGDTKNVSRRAAALVLGGIGDNRAVEPLMKILEDKDSSVRSYAAFALGEIKDKRAIDALITKLDDDDGDVRYTAADALIPVDAQRGKEILMGRLSSDRREYRKEALGGLLRICRDDTDAALLSENLDAKIPILDPQEEITEARVQLASEWLKIRVEKVRRRYEDMAADFSLKLAWSKNEYEE